MIPAAFAYEAPATLAEALSLLSGNPDGAKILAGGHSLIPAMKLRLAQPEMLIDIARIKDLAYVREEGDRIAIGALTTHCEIESSSLLQKICPLLPDCAGQIGDVQVRNKGTIGGSVAHADPAGDWPAAVMALTAEMVVVGPGGERTIKADDFFVDLLTTALAPNEILREIRLPKPVAPFGHSYQKVRHPASGFAVVGVAVALKLNANGSCESAGVGLTGVGSKAYRAAAVENALKGKTLDDKMIAEAAGHATDGVDANSDLYASEDYRRHLAVVHTKRALQQAATRAK
jgi:aerobic carbon-monoxide dehydrogenase medium subunit